MSGIAGVIAFDGRPLAGCVEAMTAAQAHRGPDGIAHWSGASSALGHCMLRTTAESLEEAQPLASADGRRVLVMDGRLDNWAELRAELLTLGARLRNRSDPELALAAFEAWGEDCVGHLRGDFAFVVLDTRTRRAFCARDRTGNKPFYYCRAGDAFAFASELHALFELPWVARVPNRGMLAEFLAVSFVSREETLWQGILRLPAAHTLVVETGQARLRRYWQPRVRDDLVRTEAEYEERYRELLFDSVRRLARSHRPVTFEVSGGLDSSAVFCVAHALQRRGELPAPGIAGFTMTFPPGDPADEVAHARALGRALGVPIREVEGSVMPPTWYGEQARFYRDFPGYSNASTGESLYREAAASGSRVVLGGEGSDTWLQGTRYYYEQELRRRRWANAAACFRADARECGRRQALYWLGRYGLFPLLPEPLQALLRAVRHPSRVTEPERYWMSAAMRAAMAERDARLDAARTPLGLDSAERRLQAQIDDAFDAQIFERIERDAARSGIELRHPYQDAPLVEFLLQVPERLRVRGKVGKYLHVRALRDLVPATILERDNGADYAELMLRQALGQRERIREAAAARPEWVDAAGVERIFARLEKPRPGVLPIWILWGIVCCDEVVPRD